MLNLRRCMPAVMFILLGWLAVGTADAQPFTCNTSAVPLQVRTEGLTELVADMKLTCTGGVVGQSLTANLAIFTNTNITSRILSGGGSEALLTIAPPPYTPATLYQGQMSGNNSLVFSGVSISMPGSGTRELNFRNVRVNATMLPVNSLVIMYVTMATSISVPISNPQQTVAMTQTGLSFEVRKTDDSASAVPNLVSCPGNNVSLFTLLGDYPTGATPGGRTFNLKFKEGFSNSFRNKTQEHGSFDNTWPVPLNTAGLADHGARLRAVFTGIPNNVTLFVTKLQVAPGTSTGVQAHCTLPSGMSCPQNASADGGLYQVPSSGEVYWEIDAASSLAVESVSFGVAVAFNPMAVSVPITAHVLGTFAPISTVGTASATEDVPRFVSSGTAIPAFTLRGCGTVLAFQFVTSSAGFDTGIAVTNMALDNPIYNTIGQTGKCTAYFYTLTGPPPSPKISPSLPPGGQWLWTMWSHYADFQGYVLVACEFQYAHGYAFVSNLGMSGPDRFAQSYQALVLPDRTRVPDPSSTSVAGSGEQLLQ